MILRNYIFFLFLLVLLSLVQSKQIICKFEDSKCMTKVAKNLFKTIITGITCLLPPTDIIHLEEIDGEIKPCFKYVVSNATLIGITGCEVTQLIIKNQTKGLVFEFGLHCPQLVLNYGFLAKGKLGAVNVNDKGKLIVTLDDYLLQFMGYYGSFISKQDHKLRMYVKSYCVDTELLGNVTVKIKELVSREKYISNHAEACVRGNVKEIETFLRRSIIEAFMKVFIDRINVYFKAYPVIDLITVDEC